MKNSLIVLFSSLLLFSCNEPENNIHYRISAWPMDKEEISVSFNYSSNKDGEIILKYENDSWGDQNIYDCIGKFSASPEPDSIIFNRDSSYITLYGVPNNAYKIDYSLKRDFEPPLLNRHRYRPIIYPSYFHLLGMRLFILPDDLFPTEESKTNISYSIELPQEAVFHSSFGSETNNTIETTREELYASVFLGGDFRKYEKEYKNKPIIFLTRGSWANLEEEKVVELLNETIQFQHEFWNDSIQRLFSVSLLPTYEEWTENSKSSSMGGSGLTHSFISFASDNPGTTLEMIRWLYNHELMHKWIGGKIKNQNEEQQYWFSEGFTDYYAYKMLLDIGKLSLSEYPGAINTEILQPYYNSPVNSIPNDEISREKFWTDYNYQKLPYQRGFIYAFYLDQQIRITSGGQSSLDDLMKEILTITQENDSYFDHNLFKSILSGYLGEKSFHEFSVYIEKGTPINLEDNLVKGLAVNKVDSIPQLIIVGDSVQLIEQLR